MLRKQERLEARVTRQQKRLIERAAYLRGTSVTDFVVASAQQAATATISPRTTSAGRCEHVRAAVEFDLHTADLVRA